jgi:hypothetical protein
MGLLTYVTSKLGDAAQEACQATLISTILAARLKPFVSKMVRDDRVSTSFNFLHY